MTAARTVATLLLSWALCSCGGGSSQTASGEGVGTGGTGITMGTVTGFGSVLVDGTSYSSATPQFFGQGSNGDDAAAAPDDVQLGAQVQVDLDTQGNPSSVRVAPELVGAVESASNAGFVVNGVQVRYNQSASAGPRTYFAGLQGPSDLANGMQVAVSGAYGQDLQGAPRVQATLVERLPDSNTLTRVSGVVAALNSTDRTFLLGSMQVHHASGTPIAPAPSGLANGVFASVWSNQPLGNGGLMEANGIRLRSLLGRSGAAQVSGLVSNLGASGFVLGGIAVDASSPALAATLAALGNGQYVSVQGTIDSTSGHIVASTLSSYASKPVPTEIQGTITGFTSSSAFFVRGVPVDASALQINGTLADGVYVSLRGTVDSSNAGVVRADALTVVGQPATGKTVEYRGVVSQFTGLGKPFVLTGRVSGNTQAATVSLSDHVRYGNGSATQLANGVTIEVEASQTTSGLSAYSVKFLSGAPPGNDTPVLVRGRVEGLNATSLRLGGLVIQRNGVQPSNGSLANGARVEVWITVAGGVATAQSIRIRD